MKRRRDAMIVPLTRPQRSAFTLLEMIIAMSLVAALMALAWSLFSIYTRLEEKGSEQALQQQLARSLMQQMRTDLRRIVVPRRDPEVAGSRPAPSSGGGSTLPSRAWLVGTERSLELVIRLPSERWLPGSMQDDLSVPATTYQMVRYHFTPHPDAQDSPSFAPLGDTLDTTSSVGSRSPEVTLLSNQSPATAIGNERTTNNATDVRFEPPTSGLARDAVWFLAPIPMSDAGRALGDRLNGVSDVGPIEPLQRASVDAATTQDLTAFDDASPPGDDLMVTPAASSPLPRSGEEHDRVPEMTRFSLRYFDGSQWLVAWDSRQDGALPIAVEFTFDIDPRVPDEPSTDEFASEGLSDPQRRLSPTSLDDVGLTTDILDTPQSTQASTFADSGTDSGAASPLVSDAESIDELLGHYRMVIAIGGTP